MKKYLKAGIVQAYVPFSIEEGESQVIKFIKQAKEKDVELLGFPEDCICGLFKYLKNYNPLEFLSKAAKDYEINLFGSNTVLEDGKYYGTGFYLDKQGKLLSKVHKITLTKPERDNGFSSGSEIQIFKTEFGKMTILVCRDAFNRYSPFWFYELKKRGVEYVLVPSMLLKFDENSKKHWLNSVWLLGRWFDVYIFAPTTVGKNYTPYPSYGNSLIVDRDNGFLRQGSEDKEELLIAEIEIRSEEKAKKAYSLKWDPILIPEVKIVDRF